MLTALLNDRAAAPAAFEHRYISPFGVLDVDMIFGYDHQSIQALVTPRYANGDILDFVNHSSYAPRLPWVSFGFYYPTSSPFKPLQIIQTAMAINHLHLHDIIHGHVHPVRIFCSIFKISSSHETQGQHSHYGRREHFPH